MDSRQGTARLGQAVRKLGLLLTMSMREQKRFTLLYRGRNVRYIEDVQRAAWLQKNTPEIVVEYEDGERELVVRSEVSSPDDNFPPKGPIT